MDRARLGIAFFAGAMFLTASAGVRAQARLPNMPVDSGPSIPGKQKVKRLEGARVDERLEQRAALDLKFVDERGASVTLKQLMADGLPTILTFNYSSCPVLCSVQLGGLVDSVLNMEWTPGRQFRVVTIALDPGQTLQQTRDTKSGYLKRLRRKGVAEGWRFASGTAENVKALAESVGYGYQYHADVNEYAHPAVLIFLSPSGVITHYMYGVKYDPAMVSGALTNAVIGRAEESAEKFILACFHYEPEEGNSKVAREVMRYGGMAFVVGLFGVFAWGRRRLRVTEPNP